MEQKNYYKSSGKKHKSKYKNKGKVRDVGTVAPPTGTWKTFGAIQ